MYVCCLLSSSMPPFMQHAGAVAARRLTPSVLRAAIIPLLQQVQKVSQTYGVNNGMWYESPRVRVRPSPIS